MKLDACSAILTLRRSPPTESASRPRAIGRDPSHPGDVAMTNRKPMNVPLLVCLLTGAIHAAPVERDGGGHTVASPDSRVVFELASDPATGRLAYSVRFQDRPVVTAGALGLDIDGQVVGWDGAASLESTQVRESEWAPPHGERARIIDHHREAVFALNGDAAAPRVRLMVRAYDEGVALRYRVESAGAMVVRAEMTSFPLPEAATVWTSRTAQGVITRQPIAAVKGLVERPLLAEIGPDLWAAFGEAALIDHARMKFERAGASTLVARLDGPCSYPGPFETPWRYVRVAGSPAALLAGNALMLNLNEPSRIGAADWIRPGKVLREVTLTTDGALRAVAFAARHRIDFVHLDAGWYGREDDDASDASGVHLDPKRSAGPLDLPAVIAAARAKGVGVILYVNRRALERQLEQILPLYESWGVAGIKFGFVRVGSQEATRWLHGAIARCADHHLMVDVHDEYRPTGVERTYPNFMTSEGVRGDEESPTTAQVLATIFTRGLAGPADHTNCYFAPRVPAMGSHAAQLAKTICVYSPWQYLFWYDRPPGPGDGADTRSVIRDVPEMSFFERLSTTWDESLILEGHPDSHVAIARRRGEAWFVGTLNGPSSRGFEIPLDFLVPDRSYRLELFTDSPDAPAPTHVRIDASTVDRSSRIRSTIAPGHGLAAILTPLPRSR
jgi:alpha-glucosidase